MILPPEYLRGWDVPASAYKPDLFMDSCNHIAMLESRGIKPTANRLLVLRTMCSIGHPVSLTELETIMETVDKSSIFRVLALFAEHNLIHGIEDGSGTMKYEVCEGKDGCSIADMHTHFYCEACHKTFCFKTINIPSISLPEGFTMNSANYIVKGTCPDCTR